MGHHKYVIEPKYSNFLAYPIHPPKTTGDPWENEVLPNCGYKVKLEKGVYSVYKNEDDLAAKKPIKYDVRLGGTNTCSQINMID